MKANNKTAAFFKARKNTDSYLIEGLKLDFSVQMEKRRKVSNLSYTQLASKIGVSAPYITKIFRGDANLTISTMFKLARAVNGKLSLKIIDENVSARPELWLAKIKPHVAASNSPLINKVINNTETVYRVAA